MKIAKRLLPLLLVVFALVGIGCHLKSRATVKAVITKELDAFKNPDSKTAQKYISYITLFPETSDNSLNPTKAQDVFSLIFQNFDYKILDIDVDKANHLATAALRLTTLDAKALAKDFAVTKLESLILSAAGSGTQNTEEISYSLDDYYHIFQTLLSENEYDTVKNTCSITLQCTDTKNAVWEILYTSAFENDLVGGLLTYLSDTDLLSPEETLSVYFQTLLSMNLEEMGTFLGIESILSSSDTVKTEIAYALTEQVHKYLNYEILTCTIHGYTATIDVEITTFDSDSIITSYQKDLENYLATPEAVIDGSEKRYENSVALLLDKINNNESTSTSAITLSIINDGVSWKLNDSDHVLGSAIFGTLSTSPMEDAIS